MDITCKQTDITLMVYRYLHVRLFYNDTFNPAF
jgi:hypothetical protein